jgi:DNA-binding Lrp family transcriptional regulator
VSFLPAKLDEIDVAIIKALMEDGRKSFREIARIASVSTPTIESRVKRMFNMGIIKKIVPLLDPEKFSEGIAAIINLKVELSELDEVLKRLAALEEVRNICVVTGESNLTIRVLVDDVKSLQDFLSKELAKAPVKIVSTNVVTKIVKEEQGVIIRPGLGIRLDCDFCGRKIDGDPVTFRVGEQTRNFCCETCLQSYKETYGSRLQALLKSKP